MGLGTMLFGWERKIRKLRKRWDRAREKALRKDEAIKMTCLEKLDIIEAHLKMLEEQRLSRIDRARFAKEIEINLAEIKEILKTKPEEFAAQQQVQRATTQKYSK